MFVKSGTTNRQPHPDRREATSLVDATDGISGRNDRRIRSFHPSCRLLLTAEKCVSELAKYVRVHCVSFAVIDFNYGTRLFCSYALCNVVRNLFSWRRCCSNKVALMSTIL